MLWSQVRGPLGLSAFFLLAACSSSSAGGAAAAGGSAGDDGQAGSSECVSAPDALFPLRQFGETDLIRQLAVDGSTLYFRTETALMSVPVAGGAVATVADLSTNQPSQFWVQSDSLLVRAEANLLAVSKAGGNPTPVGAPLAPAPSNFANAQLDGSTLYWIASDSSGYGVYSRELSGSTSTKLYAGHGELKTLQKIATTLYFVDKDASQILALKVGSSAAAVLTVADGDDDIVSADSSGLYVIGSIGVASSSNYGLYRQPLDGSSATLLDNELFIDVDSANTDSGAYFAAPANDSPNHSDPSDVSPSLLFASPSDTATTVRWCIDPSFTVHALAVQGNTAYVSVYKTSANQATIARVSLP